MKKNILKLDVLLVCAAAVNWNNGDVDWVMKARKLIE
jgi:hypothetical protein